MSQSPLISEICPAASPTTTPKFSRIPVAANSPITSRHGGKGNEQTGVDHAVSRLPIKTVESHDNGSVTDENQSQSPLAAKEEGFETYLMTGDMIIQTNDPPKEVSQDEAEVESIPNKGSHQSQIPRLETGKSPTSPKVQQKKQSQTTPSPKMSSKIPGLKRNSPHDQRKPLEILDIPLKQAVSGRVLEVTDFPIIQAPVAEMEELSDLSQSSCSDTELGNSPTLQSPASSLPDPVPDLNTPSPAGPASGTGRLEEALQTLDRMATTLPVGNIEGLSDTSMSFPEPLSSGDSGFVHDSHSSDPDLPDKGPVTNLDKALAQRDGLVTDMTHTERRDTPTERHSMGVFPPLSASSGAVSNTIVASSSGEKFSMHGGDRPLVRNSKSHENYLQAGTDLAIVNIDLDDNLAYSLDTLTCHDSPSSSSDNVTNEPSHLSRSLHNSPEKKVDKGLTGDREFIPNFINLDDSNKSVKFKLNAHASDVNNSGAENGVQERSSGNLHTNSSRSPNQQSRQVNGENGSTSNHLVNSSTGDSPLGFSVLSDDSDTESLYHQPSKAVDRPSAERLAKRLFTLEGFRKSDVSRHLCKKNDFSNLVAEEYLRFFFFQDDTLDVALRKFLSHFSLYGETQERERVLAHFSHRFMECNQGSFNSEDACHTLTCAIMLLNSDLHAPNVGRRMTSQEFIENLAELNDGDNFSKEVLKGIYQAIKNDPLEWAVDEVIPEADSQAMDQSLPPASPMPQVIGSNPFLEVPDPSKTTEYKKGYVMRKCCMEPDRRKTPFGKRGWRMMYAVLRDMILYMYKDEHHQKKGQFIESSGNAIRIHHALATKATDYTKKQHVFRLQTADWAEFLFQTGDPKQVQMWVDTINFVSASLSAPPLPGAVGSRVKFQRPLMPSSCTKFPLKEQLINHETKVTELESDLRMHRATAPEKGSKSSAIQEYLEKETFLEYELKRFETYVYLLQEKLSQFPELEPSLVETTIGECEETSVAPTTTTTVTTVAAASSTPGPDDLSVLPARTTDLVGGGKPVQRSMSDSVENPTNDLSESWSSLKRIPVLNELTECTKM